MRKPVKKAAKKPAKRATRRAPHMEKYVKLVPWGRPRTYNVELTIGGQTFRIDYANATKNEATWMRDMLCIALDAIVKDATPAPKFMIRKGMSAI